MSRPMVAFAIAVGVFQLTVSDATQSPRVTKVWDKSKLDRMDVPVAAPAYSTGFL